MKDTAHEKSTYYDDEASDTSSLISVDLIRASRPLDDIAISYANDKEESLTSVAETQANRFTQSLQKS